MRYNTALKHPFLLLWFFACSCSSSNLTVSSTGDEYHFASKKTIEYATFWEAVKNIDINYLSHQTLDGDQQEFYEALKSVVYGDLNRGEAQFENLHLRSTDSLINKYSEIILHQLYLSQSKWEMILKLDGQSNAGSETENDNILFEAFSKFPEERYFFPSQPTILQLEPAFFGNNPIVQVRINGHEKNFWLDTGAGISVIASDVAKECGILPITTKKITAGTGTSKRVGIQPALVKNLQIGELSIQNHPVIVIDKSDLEFRIFGLLRLLKIDGIIGWNAIKNMRIEIDYPNESIIIEKPVKIDTEERNMFWLGYPTVILKTSEGINLNFGLDTGANETSVYNNILKKISTENSYNKKVTEWSASGSKRTAMRIIPNMTLILNRNVLDFRDIRTRPQKGMVFMVLDGILGIDIAQDGRIIIDYLNGRFELQQ